MRMRTLVVCVSVLFLIACGEEEPWFNSVPPPTKSPSTQITVSETGGVSLQVGGRSIFATSDKAGPAVRRFTDTYQYFGGLWDFARQDEQVTPLNRFVGARETSAGSFSPYDGLPTVVPALLNLGLSGVPYATHDIGGFSSLTTPPRTKELFLRWTELGAFTPIMRTHEGDKKDQNWQWDSDAETIAHLRHFALIHEALGPEFKALARAAAQTSAPILRHLMLVFPDDLQSRGISDEFMIGESLLVAPVLEQGAVTRRLYLPPAVWYDVWSGRRYDGGTTNEVDAPIGRPPVFARRADRTDLRAIP